MRKLLRRTCRVLFSRYAISAMMIVLEVLFVTLLLVGNLYDSFLYLVVSSILLSLVTFIVILNRDANPEYKVTWTFIVLFLQPIGSILYYLFYQRRMSKKETRLINGIVSLQREHPSSVENMQSLERTCGLAAGKVRAIKADYSPLELFRDSYAEFFGSGEELFERLLEDIKAAKEYIFLEYFIIDEGELWDKIHSVLREKAAMGVEVRLLYDDIGCMKTLPSRYELGLRREGIKAYRFARVNPRVSAVHHNRDHRKICIVDGKCAYTGGCNIADEYVNLIERFGHWKDGGVRIEGLSVIGFIRMFLSLWDITVRSVSDYSYYVDRVCACDRADGGYYVPFGTGPAPTYKRPAGKNVFLNIINQAKDYVYITSPYLIIDFDLTGALCNAALRGVDVRIITPGVADKKIIKVMTKSAYPKLMEAGVRIYEYSPGFIHEKTFISDDEYAVIGTINLDYRSLVHHYEDALWSFRSPIALTARDEFLSTLEKSKLMDEKSARLGFSEWIFKCINQLFAPLL